MSGEERLLALPRFATDAGEFRPGLDRVRALLGALGAPERAFPAVHVAGTNGKGSTASMAASVAGAAGRRVGLHTSPHLLTLRERMRVDGVPAPASWLDDAVRGLESALGAVGPSFFEATLALSLAYFRDLGVDLAVVEVGLGGRLDATNVVRPAVSAVTHVGLDHTDLLGETLSEIAVEKAGIARDGVPLVHAVRDGARPALEAEARRRGAPVEAVRETCTLGAEGGRVRLSTPVGDYGALEVGLAGRHQRWNAALAVRALEVALGGRLPARAVRTGLADVAARSGLRGRAEAWGADPRVVLDVAHNPDGWRAALEAVPVPEGGRLWALVGLMADKDLDGLADAVGPRADRVLVVGLEGDRACPGPVVADAFARRGVEVEVAPSVGAAVGAFRTGGGPRDRLLVTGSHQTVAAALDLD